MSKKNNLVFDDGYKEFTINNDSNRVIRFNPTDTAIVERFNKTAEVLDALVKEFGENEPKSAAEAMKKLDAAICEQIDYIFNQPVSEVVFGGQSPMSPVGGKHLFERFLEAIIPVIKENIKAEQKLREKRIGTYVKAARGK